MVVPLFLFLKSVSYFPQLVSLYYSKCVWVTIVLNSDQAIKIDIDTESADYLLGGVSFQLALTVLTTPLKEFKTQCFFKVITT